MKLLALLLDPSYENTGYAVIDEHAKILYSGSFQCVNVQAPQRVRAHEIAYRVGQFAAMLPITHVGMEAAVGSGSGACRPLDRLNGAIGMKIYERHPHVPVYDMEVREWREAIEFKAPKVNRKEKASVRTTRLKAALFDLAWKIWPTVPFATVDAAEAALMGRRLLLHLDGTRPFVKRARKIRTAAPSSSSASPTSGKTSGDGASSPTRLSSRRRASSSRKTASTSKSAGG